MIRWCTVPEIWCATDRQMDRQMETVTYRGGAPPKNAEAGSGKSEANIKSKIKLFVKIVN